MTSTFINAQQIPVPGCAQFDVQFKILLHETSFIKLAFAELDYQI